MAFLSSFFKSFYAKALFVIALGAIGVTAGVKIGYTYFLTEKNITFAGPPRPPASSLSFEAGDLFPWENYVTENNDTGNFEQLLVGDKQSLILFTDLGCPTCLELLAFWKKTVRPELLSDVQEITYLPMIDNPIPDHYRALFEGFTVLYYDTLWRKKYQMSFTPIIVGVDKHGFVTYRQFGFDGYIEYPIVNRFCLGK